MPEGKILFAVLDYLYWGLFEKLGLTELYFHRFGEVTTGKFSPFKNAKLIKSPPPPLYGDRIGATRGELENEKYLTRII